LQRINAEAEQHEARLRAAAAYIADALYDGWNQAVAQPVAKYVTHQTRQRAHRIGPAHVPHLVHEQDVSPLAAQRADLERYIRWTQGRPAPQTPATTTT
jgi:hypothetical protein